MIGEATKIREATKMLNALLIFGWKAQAQVPLISTKLARSMLPEQVFGFSKLGKNI